MHGDWAEQDARLSELKYKEQQEKEQQERKIQQRELSENQRAKLMDYIKAIHDIEQRVWGLLPPSQQRDSARIRLHNARMDLESLFFYKEEK